MLRLFVSVASLAVISCASHETTTFMTGISPEKMSEIKLGASKEEVVQLMGSPRVKLRAKEGPEIGTELWVYKDKSSDQKGDRILLSFDTKGYLDSKGISLNDHDAESSLDKLKEKYGNDFVIVRHRQYCSHYWKESVNYIYPKIGMNVSYSEKWHQVVSLGWSAVNERDLASNYDEKCKTATLADEIK